DAAEALEVFYPLHRIQEEGWKATVAAPNKKTLQTVVHDFGPEMETYTEKLGYRIEAEVAITDTKPSDFDGLVIPGGRAPEYIRNAPGVADWVKAFIESGRPVAGTCHAGLLLAKAGVLSGRKCAAYPELACDIETAGGTFIDEAVVIDENLITARAWPDNPQWMREFIQAVHHNG
ncbi:MAG: DJ-1/PfpI family protein, partial [Candidatus Omnitrophica bacterium]|nr:DJ-1/PfpI family protein [Candidatus Omnitrophota bacterium]